MDPDHGDDFRWSKLQWAMASFEFGILVLFVLWVTTSTRFTVWRPNDSPERMREK